MNIHSVTNVNFNRGDDANEQAEKLEKFIFSIMDSYYHYNDRNDA